MPSWECLHVSYPVESVSFSFPFEWCYAIKSVGLAFSGDCHFFSFHEWCYATKSRDVESYRVDIQLGLQESMEMKC